MPSQYRPRAAFIIALTLVMVIPVTAAAKPTSSFVAELSTNGLGSGGSLEFSFDEFGDPHLGLSASEFELITCTSGQGTLTMSWTADGPVVGSVTVSRKLDELSVSGTVELTTTVSTYCPDTGVIEQTTTSTEEFELQGVSSEKLSRSRSNGNRVLSSTLSPLTFTSSELSMAGPGMLTETISK